MTQTMTPGGHRLLVRTLTAPSTDIASINTRLDVVEAFVQRDELRDELREAVRSVGDVMRVIQRFRGRRGEGREAWEVGVWIRTVDRLLAIIRGYLKEERMSLAAPAPAMEALQALVERFRPVSDVADMIEKAVDEVALTMGLASAGEGEGSGEEGETDIEGDDVTVSSLASAPAPAKKHETKKEKQEREKAQSEMAKWWMRPE
jgi:DNA mismatch repair ATPase MutS